MCQPKYWLKIFTEELIEDRQKYILRIYAERSDLEEFHIQIELEGNDCLGSIASKVKKAIDSLESYRDCDCTEKNGTCVKHLNLLKVPQLGAPDAAFTIVKGR